MENEPLSLGLEDGAIDVERLLVEPPDGHASMDSVLCCNEKVPKNANEIEEASGCYGGANSGGAREEKDLLNGEALDPIHCEELGYFRLQNDFCSIGEEYLLGVEFAESITNLDYGSGEGFQASVSDIPLLASTSGTDTPWKSDLFRVMKGPGDHSDQLGIGSSELSDLPYITECEPLAVEKPLNSSNLQIIAKIEDISNCSIQDVSSDENDGSQSPLIEVPCSPKLERTEKKRKTGRETNTIRFQGQDAASVTMPAQLGLTDTLGAQKRSRKPTQRYIDELADTISRCPKKRQRREGPSYTLKEKPRGVKDHKKLSVGSKSEQLPAEESSVKAIQVPFASLVHKECPKSNAHDMAHGSDRGNLLTNSTNNHFSLENQKRRGECFTTVHVRKRDDFSFVNSQKTGDNCYMVCHSKKGDDCLTPANLKKRDGWNFNASPKSGDDGITEVSLKKRNGHVRSVYPNKNEDHVSVVCMKERDDFSTAETPRKRSDRVLTMAQKRDVRFTVLHPKKSDDCDAEENSDEVCGRRKHHRLWTIAEVKKLIDGVSQYGVGRWSRIKKLFFSASAHRTSVDLKDKWRNLLKASGILEQGNRQGEKKRNPAWRPLPKSILRQVCELAAMHPYPKGRKPRISHIHRDSPDRSTDITLNDYKRILRSINGN